MKNKIWTFSNMLSVCRIVLMIPACYLLYVPFKFHREYAVLIILIAVITDALDGYFARKFDEISELGKIIDPLADKIGIGIVVVMLTIFGDIPLWFTGVVLGRDVLIFIAGVYIKKRTGIILPSMMAGKIAVSFLALTLVLALLRYPIFETLHPTMIWVTIGTLFYSMIVYAKRFFKTLQEFNAH